MLLALMLVGLVAALSSCTDIPDESPEAVRVSFAMSDRSAGASSSNRQLSRTPYIVVNEGSVSVAYVFEKSVYEVEEALGGSLYGVEGKSDLETFISLAYSSGVYTHKFTEDAVGKQMTRGGTAEGLSVPLDTEVIVFVIAWTGAAETSDADFGYKTDSFTVTAGETKASVLVDGGDWAFSLQSDTPRPSSVKALVIDNLTNKNGTVTSILEILQWEDNPIYGFSIIYSGSTYDGYLGVSPDRVELSSSCATSDNIYLQNSDNTSCISITTSVTNYGYPAVRREVGEQVFTHVDLFRVKEKLEPKGVYYITFDRSALGADAGEFSSDQDNSTHATFKIDLNNLSSVTDDKDTYLWTDEWITAP